MFCSVDLSLLLALFTQIIVRALVALVSDVEDSSPATIASGSMFIWSKRGRRSRSNGRLNGHFHFVEDLAEKGQIFVYKLLENWTQRTQI
jgi:hypothetical protein